MKKRLLFSGVAMWMVFLFSCGTGGGVEPIVEGPFTVTVTDDGNGTAKADRTLAVVGDTVALRAIPDTGYLFEKWTVVEPADTYSENTLNPSTFVMPAVHISIRASFVEIASYPITVTDDGNGTAVADRETAAEGEEVTLTATPNEGFLFSRWTVVEGELSFYNYNPVTFTMPASPVEIRAEFVPEKTYAIGMRAFENGTVKASHQTAREGTVVTLTATPDPGFLFSQWMVSRGYFSFPLPRENPVTFVMPASDVLIGAMFVSDRLYAITLDVDGPGTAVADRQTAEQYAPVTLTATPESGYVFDRWEVSYDLPEPDGTMPDLSDNPVTFFMQAADAHVKATFYRLPEEANLGGVTWARYNVAAPGTFATRHADEGMFYQFNRRTGWSFSDPLASAPTGATWNGASYTATTWEPANDPCPVGWRVPTREELAKLCDAGRVTVRKISRDGIGGNLYIDKTTGDAIFLPAEGYRASSGGTLVDVSRITGKYWSSSVSNARVAYLSFYSVSINEMTSTPDFAGANSVRCVKQ